MKRSWFITIPLILMLSACGSPSNNANVTYSPSAVTSNDNTTPDTSPNQSNIQIDAYTYATDMRGIIDNINQIRGNYQTFLNDCHVGKYGASEVVRQVDTFNSEIQDAEIKSNDVNVPDDMQQYHEQFKQSLTDLMNSASSMQDAAVHSITGSSKKDTSNASAFLTKFDDEWLKYLTTVNNLAKGQ